MNFGTPDKNLATKEPDLATNEPQADAPQVDAQADAYDLSDYIAQSREKASTGSKQKLEANDFNDEELLASEGHDNFSDDFDEAPEVEELPQEPVELSDEWLEIFAWAGVELTDEIMPRVLQYLHADSNPDKFKLQPSRRDRLKLAWLAFLRKVLPAWSDQQGLFAVIIMLYIEHIVVGVWKLFGRIMSGAFKWPDFWPFSRFNKKDELDQEQPPAPANEPPPFESHPVTTNGQPEILSKPIEPAPSEAILLAESAEKLSQPVQEVKSNEIIEAPLPEALPNGQFQDALDKIPFDREKGMPVRDWQKTHPVTEAVYKAAAKSFRSQKSFQAWLHETGFYKNRK